LKRSNLIHITFLLAAIQLFVASISFAQTDSALGDPKEIKPRRSWFEIGFGPSLTSRMDQPNGMAGLSFTYTYVPKRFLPVRLKWMSQVAFEAYGQTSGELDVLMGAITRYDASNRLRMMVLIGFGYYTGERITQQVDRPGYNLLGIKFPPEKYLYKAFRTLGVPVELEIQGKRFGAVLQGNINTEMPYIGVAGTMMFGSRKRR
jgi:hypothetical protein